MRELEFLPDWYPQARRRARLLRMECWVALLLLAGLGTWLALAQRNVRQAEASAATVATQLAQSELELMHLRQQLELKAQLEVQKQIVARLGLPVETSRLLRTLDALMAKEMSLQELSLDTEERVRQVAQGAAAPAAPAPGAGDPPLERRLRVKLLAVAPSDVDLANFLVGLTNTPFFEQVSMTFSRDRSEGGHLMRQFEVTFSMDLNHPMVQD